MLRQSLRQITADPQTLLEAAAIPDTARAEEIDIPGFCALARALQGLRDRAEDAR
jgi:16S rRNA (adenine1518-N6/adenine1519-N6)-dimethyltransferase